MRLVLFAINEDGLLIFSAIRPGGGLIGPGRRNRPIVTAVGIAPLGAGTGPVVLKRLLGCLAGAALIGGVKSITDGGTDEATKNYASSNAGSITSYGGPSKPPAAAPPKPPTVALGPGAVSQAATTTASSTIRMRIFLGRFAISMLHCYFRLVLHVRRGALSPSGRYRAAML
jgi:hypothetical protein